MKTDLSYILNKIDVSITPDPDVSTQASQILEAISGEQESFDIGGGEQPSVFQPTITQSINTVSWSRNSGNGSFDITTKGYVDDVEVSSPLSITSSLDGKTLIISTQGTNFQGHIDQVSLVYQTITGLTLTLNLDFSNLSASQLCYVSMSFNYMGNTSWGISGQELHGGYTGAGGILIAIHKSNGSIEVPADLVIKYHKTATATDVRFWLLWGSYGVHNLLENYGGTPSSFSKDCNGSDLSQGILSNADGSKTASIQTFTSYDSSHDRYITQFSSTPFSGIEDDIYFTGTWSVKPRA